MSVFTMPTRWRLGELMARYRITGKAMAKELGVSDNAVSALKRAKTMPRIDGKRLDEIAKAVSDLAGPDVVVRGVDLLERAL